MSGRIIVISAGMWALVAVSLLGLVIAVTGGNYALVAVFLAAALVFAAGAILTALVYGFNRLIEFVTQISKRG